jgi:plastocyanin
MKSLALIAGLGFGALFLGACSSTPQPLDMTIRMSEFSYEPDRIEAKVGQQITLNLVNDGALEHEIMFGQNMMMGDAGQPNGYETDMFTMANMEPMVTFGEGMEGMDMGEGQMGMGDHGGYMVTMPGMGMTAQMTFTVTEDMVGEWEFGCFAQEGTHYDQGMAGTMVVTE